MIECVEGTVTPVDERVLRKMQTDSHWVEWHGLRFDDEYVKTLPLIHGGTPRKPYFTDATDTVRRIGWFVSFYDEESALPGPALQDHMYGGEDTRVVDRSLPYLLDGCSSMYCQLDDLPTRFYPFAALYDDPHDESTAPATLCWHFSSGSDSVCFDTSTTPFSIVYCNFRKALDESANCDYDLDYVYDFGHLIRVANSFQEFAKSLRAAP